MKARFNWLDRGIGWFNPALALKRGLARGMIEEHRAYDGASTGRRTQGWNTSSTAADVEIAGALSMLRNRSRDLTRNNPHARKAVAVWVNNLVGDGIRPRANTGNPKADEQINKAWEAWCKQADADGQLDFYGMQELAVREMVEGGEIIIRRRVRRADDGLPVPLQLQLYEGDHLDMTKTGVVGSRVINGIEFDAIGRRTAYWLYPDHPGNTTPLLAPYRASQSVSADEIIHLYRKERTAVRGTPWCSSVIRSLRDHDDYENAEIVRKKTEACVTAIVTGADVGDEAIAPFTTTPPAGMSVQDVNGRPIEHFEPGLIAYAHGAKEIKFNNPQSNDGFVDYKKASLHSIAAGYLLPYELLTGDLSEVNFSSARVGLTEFRRLCGVVQWLCLAPMLLDPVWRWFCASAYLTGQIPQRDIPVEWGMPKFESVNPIDDARADILEIRSGLKTWAQAVSQRGWNSKEQLAEIAATNKEFDAAEVILDIDPRHVSQAGQAQQSEQANEAEKPADPPAKRLRAI